MILRAEVLMGRDVEYPLDDKLEDNLSRLLICLNKFRQQYGQPMLVSSGYRPGKYNQAAGGAEHSAHLTCEACDFHDPDGVLKKFVTDRPDILTECGLWMESPTNTPTWIHLDIRARYNRIFLK